MAFELKSTKLKAKAPLEFKASTRQIAQIRGKQIWRGKLFGGVEFKNDVSEYPFLPFPLFCWVRFKPFKSGRTKTMILKNRNISENNVSI